MLELGLATPSRPSLSTAGGTISTLDECQQYSERRPSVLDILRSTDGIPHSNDGVPNSTDDIRPQH